MTVRLVNKIARAIYYYDDDEMEVAVRLAKRIVKAVEQSIIRRTKLAADASRKCRGKSSKLSRSHR